MGLNCTKYCGEPGVCIWCLEECHTKVCKCSYAHRECSRSLFKHSGRCSICYTRFIHSWSLQPLPKTTIHEEQIELMLQAHQQSVLRKKRYAYRCWANTFFPVFMSYLKRHNARPRKMIIAFETLTEDLFNKRSFEQFMMDRCWKQVEIDDHMKIMHLIVETYDVMDLRLKKDLVRCFKTHRK